MTDIPQQTINLESVWPYDSLDNFGVFCFLCIDRKYNVASYNKNIHISNSGSFGFTVCKVSHHAIYPTSRDGSSCESKASQMSKHLHSTRGFLTHAQGRKPISSGRKKEVHTQSHACAVCLSLQAKLLHLFRKLHAFFRHPKVAWCQGRA